MDSIRVTLIYLDHCMLLSRKRYQDWREIQDEYWDNYKTNLLPMTYEELICFFKDDYGEETNWPFSKSAIINFFEGNSETMKSAQQQAF